MISAGDLWLFPLFGVVDLIRVRYFLNVECVLFATLLLLFLLEGGQFGVLRPILPIVDHIFACNDHMGLVHCHIFGVNCYVLVLNGTPDSIAKYDDPLVWLFLYSRD
jgi:hypothetical protein